MTEGITMAPVIDVAQARQGTEPIPRDVVFAVQGLTVSYGRHAAISDVDLDIYRNVITAVIGPSGCGKTTFIRCLNRMNDLVPGARIEGHVLYHGEDLYASGVDPVEVRRRIGMVFQKANPFPKSIYDNVAWGPRVLGLRKELDEPCSALDPISTAKIEELINELKNDYTIAIVTHNMQQAARVSDFTAFMYLGELIEFDSTDKIFTRPSDPRTQDYITGRFG